MCLGHSLFFYVSEKLCALVSGLFKQDLPDQPEQMEVLQWSAMGWEDLVVPYSFS